MWQFSPKRFSCSLHWLELQYLQNGSQTNITNNQYTLYQLSRYIKIHSSNETLGCNQPKPTNWSLSKPAPASTILFFLNFPGWSHLSHHTWTDTPWHSKLSSLLGSINSSTFPVAKFRSKLKLCRPSGKITPSQVEVLVPTKLSHVD